MKDLILKILGGASKFKPQNFNDFLCLFILGIIFVMWILDGVSQLDFTLNPEVLTATIIFFTLIGQFYYRKKSEEK
jgi:hypothetical protein